VHDAIRKNPDRQKKERKEKPKREHLKKRQVRLTNAQRKDRIKKKIAIEMKKAASKKK